MAGQEPRASHDIRTCDAEDGPRAAALPDGPTPEQSSSPSHGVPNSPTPRASPAAVPSASQAHAACAEHFPAQPRAPDMAAKPVHADRHPHKTKEAGTHAASRMRDAAADASGKAATDLRAPVTEHGAAADAAGGTITDCRAGVEKRGANDAAVLCLQESGGIALASGTACPKSTRRSWQSSVQRRFSPRLHAESLETSTGGSDSEMHVPLRQLLAHQGDFWHSVPVDPCSHGLHSVSVQVER